MNQVQHCSGQRADRSVLDSLSSWSRRKSLRMTKHLTLTSRPSTALANSPRSVCCLLPQPCLPFLCSHLHQLVKGAAAFQGITGLYRCCIGDRGRTGPLSIAKNNANYKKTEIFLSCLEKSMTIQGLNQTNFDEIRNTELVLELTLKKFQYIRGSCVL